MFFKRNKDKPTVPETVAPEPDTDDDAGIPWDQPEEATDDETRDAELEWRRRAAAVIPGGASTGSKRPAALLGDDDEQGPAHYLAASGYTVLSAGGPSYTDFTMALGAVALGYADPGVSAAVGQAIANGNVAGMSPALEVEIAERLCEVVPCAEGVRFLKTGAEACAAAVRIARTATGRRRVVGSGYFGWLGWWTGDEPAAGVPAGMHADYVRVPFDDVAALRAAVADAGSDLAAVILEPVVERLPSPEWIAAARELCDQVGAVLVFDEIKTGFRLATGGYQQYASVTPDLATFGKAMANGFPIAAVVGKRDVMDAAARTWISSTLASETTALAAVGAVLDYHEKAEICEALWSIGAELRGAVERAAQASGLPGVEVVGVDPMWLFRFDDASVERRFLSLCRDERVLFKRGAYNFACAAHDDRAIAAAERAASTAFVHLAEERRGRGHA